MYISINEGFTKITGYTEKETVGKTSIELNIWADLSDRDKLVKGIKANGKVENLETTFKMKDGSLRKGIMSAALIDLDGVPHILSMTRDVTERKQAEMALLKSKEQYDSLISNIPVGVYILHSSPEGAFALDYVSPRMAEMINLSVYALLSDARNIFQAIHPDDRDGFIKLNREGIQHQRPFDWKGRVIHNGMIRWLHVRSTPELQEDGDTLWHGIIVDITERKQAEEELKERSRDLQNELENKTKAEKELQRSLNQLDISRLATLNLLENIKIEMEQRKKVEEEVKRLNAGLEIRVLERTSQFEETNKELEAFAYSVSHDLRAPLRAIDGFSKFVLEDYGRKLDKEGQRLLGLIRSNTQKMDQLITDILTLSRVTRSEHKVSKVDMTKMALSMLNEAVSPEIQEKLSLKIDELPEAFADSTYMKQVWINLISNAVKFSSLKKKQMITIGGFNREGFHVYYVKDNGVGFNQEYAHKLFGVFQRLHKDDEFEGTGVGLAIVQRIIHRHGGKVWAEGKEGKGATFYFSLPAKKSGY
jgi:PAS domain S-box-containing protein